MGRPKSEKAHTRVLEATAELVAERGIDSTSVDAISERSGVSKATIYKHWADKDALLLEMIAHIHGVHARPKFDTGNTRTDLIAVLAYRPKQDATLRERIMPQFAAAAARRANMWCNWKDIVMDPPRRELRHLLELGVKKGEIRDNLDYELSLALLLGPVMYWFVLMRRHTEDPGSLANNVVDAFWRAFGVPTAR